MSGMFPRVHCAGLIALEIDLLSMTKGTFFFVCFKRLSFSVAPDVIFIVTCGTAA